MSRGEESGSRVDKEMPLHLKDDRIIKAREVALVHPDDADDLQHPKATEEE